MSETQLPDQIDLEVDEEYSIVLPNAGVSGYVWQLQTDGDRGVVDATLRREQATSSAAMVGRAMPEILALRALAGGNVTLHLLHRRPWERDGIPLESHSIIVRVT